MLEKTQDEFFASILCLVGTPLRQLEDGASDSSSRNGVDDCGGESRIICPQSCTSSVKDMGPCPLSITNKEIHISVSVYVSGGNLAGRIGCEATKSKAESADQGLRCVRSVESPSYPADTWGHKSFTVPAKSTL